MCCRFAITGLEQPLQWLICMVMAGHFQQFSRKRFYLSLFNVWVHFFFFNKEEAGRWWYNPCNLRSLGQVDHCNFEASQGYTARPFLKNQQQQKQK